MTTATTAQPLPRLLTTQDTRITRSTFYLTGPGRTHRAQRKMITLRGSCILNAEQRRALVDICDNEGRALSLHCRDQRWVRRMMARDAQFGARVMLITPLSYRPNEVAA